MNNRITTYILTSLISLSAVFTSCTPQTIEQQVEEIMKSQNAEERQTISYALADSLNIHAAELLLGLHSNPVSTEALRNMLVQYSEIIKSDPSKTEKAIECISYITEPSSKIHDSLNNRKIDLIIYALKIENINENYELTLINSAKQHENRAMLRIIDAWYEDKNSNSTLNAIKAFENEAIGHLVSQIETDTNAVDLLARFGNPVLDIMIEKMKDNKQSVRFAAGDVLVKMMKYDPDAVIMLTSAIDLGSIDIIANNYPFYIRLGQLGTEKRLLSALDLHFNQEMCLDILNCGSSELESGATDIAAKHGYRVFPGAGSHSGPRWGSGN